jgi:hypothetical protein
VDSVLPVRTDDAKDRARRLAREVVTLMADQVLGTDVYRIRLDLSIARALRRVRVGTRAGVSFPYTPILLLLLPSFFDIECSVAPFEAG